MSLISSYPSSHKLMFVIERHLENIAPFVGAIAEGLYQRTGLLVSIMLAGPIPSDQGRIGVRRYVCYVGFTRL